MSDDHLIDNIDNASPPEYPEDRRSPFAALSGCNCPDGCSDAGFDDLVRLAATVCQTPIALVRLAWEGGQSGQSHIGIEPSEHSLADVFYSLAQESGGPLVVSDIVSDTLLASKPAEPTEISLRSFVGVPLITSEHVVIGTLCVADRVAREYTADQVSALQTVGRQIVALAELRRANHQIAREREENLREREAIQQQSERLYRTLGEAVPDLVWACNAKGEALFVNRRWTEYTGLTLDEAAHIPANVFHHPDDYPRLVAAWKSANGEPYSIEVRIRRHDGVYRWFLIRAVPLKDEQGAILQWIGTTTDIHERIMAEEALRQSEEKYRRVAEKEHFLAESSAALASSLDYETTLCTVAKLAVPDIADWCVVHVVDPAASVRQLAVAHSDPSKVRWAEELQARYPYDPDAAAGVPNVLRNGIAEYYPSITDEMLAASARDAEHLRIMREVGFTSVMIVPMNARGQTLGAITFVSAESGRRYGASSLAIAQDLAHSAALAVDNSRSFNAAQQEILRRMATEQQLRSHQDEIEALNARLRMSAEVTHHHVRNNLQIILALTQLPIEDGKDTVPVTALGRIEHHTCSLAAMHDLLMERAREEADVERISARTALDRLVPMLAATSRGRDIQYRADDIALPVQEIGSLCILVNELITNAIRHGSGKIQLTIAAQGGNIRLEVCDEGQGFPADFDWRTGSGTGLSLIDIAGRHDLRGRITFENRSEGGGRVVVEFPANTWA